MSLDFDRMIVYVSVVFGVLLFVAIMTYAGTPIDCFQFDWAPINPHFTCEQRAFDNIILILAFAFPLVYGAAFMVRRLRRVRLFRSSTRS